ncbi:MAG: MspA family porin [Mycobacterium sp.]|jgi:hypothetical protein
MLNRFAIAAASCLLLGAGVAPTAMADPATDPVIAPAGAAEVAPPAPVAPPADNGIVPSAGPGIAKTPDGRTLTVVAKDETQLPIAPLTTSLSSRDWLVGATFTGSTTGSTAGGTLEVGYQIGCGIEMNNMKLAGSIGGTFGNSTLGIAGFNAPGTISAPITGAVEVYARPGTVTNVIVDKKTFKATSARVTVKDIHMKVDGCVGASSIRSYAVLTSSSTDEDDLVAYYGITKTF